MTAAATLGGVTAPTYSLSNEDFEESAMETRAAETVRNIVPTVVVTYGVVNGPQVAEFKRVE